MSETNDNGTQSIKIQGFHFDVPAPYSEGHVLNGAEASALNQLYAENVRNNNASKIKKALEEHVKAGGTEANFELSDALRQEIQTAANEYKFGERRTRTAEPADPVEREAQRIAGEAVREALRKKGVKVKDLAEGVYDQLVERHAKTEGVVAEAKRRVKAKEKIGSDELDLGDLTAAAA